MAAKLLINEKWRSHQYVTGVQRYASQLIDSLNSNGLEYDSAQPTSSSRISQTIWEQCKLPTLAKKYDTLLCPANMAPLVMPNGVRLVLTLHCLRFYYHPENYPPSFVAWYRFAMPKLIENASTVLTVSETAASEIQSVYPGAKGKVQVVYPGVSNHFQVSITKTEQNALPGPYWVFVGNAGGVKNMRVLIESLQFSGNPHRIMLLGVNTEQLHAFFNQHPYLIPCSSMVTPLGHVNDIHRVASIMGNAAGLLAPSRYESFNLPLIEAMACGIPVLASDTKVHREIGADVPVFISQSDAQAWAHAMDSIVNDHEHARNLGEQGIARAADFTWDVAAKSVIHILKDLSD